MSLHHHSPTNFLAAEKRKNEKTPKVTTRHIGQTAQAVWKKTNTERTQTMNIGGLILCWGLAGFVLGFAFIGGLWVGRRTTRKMIEVISGQD